MNIIDEILEKNESLRDQYIAGAPIIYGLILIILTISCIVGLSISYLAKNGNEILAAIIAIIMLAGQILYIRRKK